MNKNPTPEKNKATIEILRNCARCKGDHGGLTFTEFTNPSNSMFTHWCMCPTSGEPILLTQSDRDTCEHITERLPICTSDSTGRYYVEDTNLFSNKFCPDCGKENV